MIEPEIEARIRRLFFAEHWTVGTIASELALHHSVVERVVGVEQFMRGLNARRSPSLAPYTSFIHATLAQYPRLRSTRLWHMLKARGYSGGVHVVRRYVRDVRPKPRAEVFLRIETLPGEQAQVDWAHFGKVQIGNTTRTLSCFVMVLGYSRAMFGRFFLDQTTDNFLRGHVDAFKEFGGVARKLLYDNLKSVVIDRVGEHVKFHPRLLELANHYCFEPVPCAPYRGNEKGKVERSIHYLRYSFFEGRVFGSLEQINQELRDWIRDVAHQRTLVGHDTAVKERLEAERERLLALPENAFVPDSTHALIAKKTPYLRFDLNDYSIPPSHVGVPLTLVASQTHVRVLDGTSEIACHRRSYERHRRIEAPEHIAAIKVQKRDARALRGRHRLFDSCPSAEAFVSELVRRGDSPSHTTLALLRLVDTYDAKSVNDAIVVAEKRGAFGTASVEHIIEQERIKRQQKPPTGPILLRDERLSALRTKTHALKDYDALSRQQPSKNPNDSEVQP